MTGFGSFGRDKHNAETVRALRVAEWRRVEEKHSGGPQRARLQGHLLSGYRGEIFVARVEGVSLR
jgi:hypothetical protein